MHRTVRLLRNFFLVWGVCLMLYVPAPLLAAPPPLYTELANAPYTDQLVITLQAPTIRTATDTTFWRQFGDGALRNGLPGARYKRTLDYSMYVLKAPRLLSRSEITVLQTTWLQIPGVALVEPDVIVQTNAVPNDPEYPNQWHYFSPTTPVNGKTYAGIDAPGAWDQGAHGMGAVAAVLDTGITPHPDLGVTQINGVVTDASQGSEVTIDNVALSNTLNAVSVPTAVVVP